MAPDPPAIQFLDRLLSQLSQYATRPEDQLSSGTNSLGRIPPAQQPKVKALLLTLHCLFPNELLLALDILDRGLVRRIGDDAPRAPPDGDDTEEGNIYHEPPSNINDNPNTDNVFFVTSSSGPGSYPNKEKSYEVRLHAWNCTCPTFSLLEFRAPFAEPQLESESLLSSDAAEPSPSGQCYGSFGGTLSRAKSSAVCKHLLACVLLVRCPGIFGGCQRVANREELAGLCAGWGG